MSEKFEAKAAGAKSPQAQPKLRRGRFWHDNAGIELCSQPQ